MTNDAKDVMPSLKTFFPGFPHHIIYSFFPLEHTTMFQRIMQCRCVTNIVNFLQQTQCSTHINEFCCCLHKSWRDSTLSNATEMQWSMNKPLRPSFRLIWPKLTLMVVQVSAQHVDPPLVLKVPLFRTYQVRHDLENKR